MDYLNIGDALSPVMVALLSGLDVRRVPTRSQNLRMACVGTIGHGFGGGETHFWGTGSSMWTKPRTPNGERLRFEVPQNSLFKVHATRGPISEKILTGEENSVGVYGDPVWLLPKFYNPPVKKRWKLGVIVHLSELNDRASVPNLKQELSRYEIPDFLSDDVRVINTVCSIGMDAIKEKLDEILSCERIVSTSLHGMVFAEAYRIPCLHFSTRADKTGLHCQRLDVDDALDLRVMDLYRGLGKVSLAVYSQRPECATDWENLLEAIDKAYEPKVLDEDALINAFPVDYAPVGPSEGRSVWEHPVLQSICLQHDVSELKRNDKARAKS